MRAMTRESALSVVISHVFANRDTFLGSEEEARLRADAEEAVPALFAKKGDHFYRTPPPPAPRPASRA